MKTKFSIIFMWLFTILFISCDKLDLYPEDSLSPTTYFKNENELQLYSNQFYYNILPYFSPCFFNSYQTIAKLIKT